MIQRKKGEQGIRNKDTCISDAVPKQCVFNEHLYLRDAHTEKHTSFLPSNCRQMMVVLYAAITSYCNSKLSSNDQM